METMQQNPSQKTEKWVLNQEEWIAGRLPDRNGIRDWSNKVWNRGKREIRQALRPMTDNSVCIWSFHLGCLYASKFDLQYRMAQPFRTSCSHTSNYTDMVFHPPDLHIYPMGMSSSSSQLSRSYHSIHPDIHNIFIILLIIYSSSYSSYICHITSSYSSYYWHISDIIARTPYFFFTTSRWSVEKHVHSRRAFQHHGDVLSAAESLQGAAKTCPSGGGTYINYNWLLYIYIHIYIYAVYIYIYTNISISIYTYMYVYIHMDKIDE